MKRNKAQENIRNHYENRISPERDHHDVLDWASAESQLKRFEVLSANVNLEGKTLLDVGCGLGDLFRFLKDQRIKVDYTGVDLLQKMVIAANKKNPDGLFIQADVFVEETLPPELEKKIDVIFCSGIFNLNLGNNVEFLRLAVGKLLKLTDEYLVFNLLHKRAAGPDRKYFYFDPDVVLELLDNFECETTILDDYLPNDFTVICKKIQF